MRTRDLLYPLRILKQVLYLPKTVHQRHLEELSALAQIRDLKVNVTDVSSQLEQSNTQIEDVKRLLRVIDTKIANVKHDTVKVTRKATKTTGNPVNNTIADDHSLDSFYKQFEDRFRGSEESIKERVSEYKSMFDALPKKVRELPVVDLGCGRGEFLAFAKNDGLTAIGIDMNYDMVDRAKDLGFTAYCTDAMTYLSEQEAGSVAVITGFHIVEHIPFGSLMKLFEECYRCITPEGFVLFETPNPKNLTIGASNFYIDPSHIKPIPPELLSFALESVGFKAEIIPTHPVREPIEHSDEEVMKIMQIIYGPQDYAVLARKI